MAALPDEVTQLLIKWSKGDEAALDELIPLVHAELRRLAKRYMGREREDHTLQTSALINEAYLRLIDQQRVEWKDRAHFFAVSAQIMRHILVDHARKYHSDKRGAGAQKLPLDDLAVSNQQKAAELDHSRDYRIRRAPFHSNRIHRRRDASSENPARQTECQRGSGYSGSSSKRPCGGSPSRYRSSRRKARECNATHGRLCESARFRASQVY